MIFLVIFLQVLFCFLSYGFLKNKLQRFSIVICNIGFFLYSCYGIIQYNLDYIYYYSYIKCVITLNVCFVIGDKCCSYFAKDYYFQGNHYGCYSDFTLQNRKDYLKWITYIYFIARIVWLVYPEFNLKYVFQAPNFLYRNSLEAASLSVSNPIGKILSTFTNITLPFALIYIRNTGKKKRIVMFFAFDLYLQYLMGRASVGRLAIIKNILVVCMFFFFTEENVKKKRKYVIISISAILLSFIIYVVIENLRSGQEISLFDLKISDSINHFVESELYYPSHYPLADKLNNAGVYSPSIFWTWLFTLPIPKTIFHISSVDSYSSIIYRVYTYYYWGGHWGNEKGYAGMLLSVMGDGVLVYGADYAFIIIIPFALFIGFFLRYLTKIKDCEIMYCTALFYFFVSFRPGVQYALQYINTLVGMLAFVLVFRFATVKRIRGNH